MKQRIVKSFGHKDVASEDASEWRPFDFVDGVNEMVLRLVLLHCQLKLAHAFSDLDLQNDVLGLLFVEPVIHFEDFVAFLEAHLVHQS